MKRENETKLVYKIVPHNKHPSSSFFPPNMDRVAMIGMGASIDRDAALPSSGQRHKRGTEAASLTGKGIGALPIPWLGRLSWNGRSHPDRTV